MSFFCCFLWRQFNACCLKITRKSIAKNTVFYPIVSYYFEYRNFFSSLLFWCFMKFSFEYQLFSCNYCLLCVSISKYFWVCGREAFLLQDNVCSNKITFIFFCRFHINRYRSFLHHFHLPYIFFLNDFFFFFFFDDLPLLPSNNSSYIFLSTFFITFSNSFLFFYSSSPVKLFSHILSSFR